MRNLISSTIDSRFDVRSALNKRNVVIGTYGLRPVEKARFLCASHARRMTADHPTWRQRHAGRYRAETHAANRPIGRQLPWMRLAVRPVGRGLGSPVDGN
ncbi:MAG: hypothetical protein HQ581_12190 [Planctomycetes bacterium]|nr:hypothetical protein [Planctomycetota bacterium]